MAAIQIAIKALLKTKDELLPIFKEWCKDKTVPLDERWELFISSNLGEHRDYYVHPDCGIELDSGDLYDKLEYRKFQYIAAIDFVAAISDRKDEGGDVNLTKEYFLENFIKSFVNDW